MPGSWWRTWGRTIVFATVMIAVGNAKSILGPRTLAGSPVTAAVGVAVAVASLVYARRVGLTRADLALTDSRSAIRSVAAGLAAVGAAVLAARGLTAVGVPIEPPPAPGDLATLPWEDVVRRIAVYLPFDTALPEEMAFRAVLWAEVRRNSGSWKVALIGSTLAFAAWHLALGVQESDGHYDVLAKKLAAYFGGGLLFAVPRASGNLAGCVTTHWLTDAILFYAGRPEGQWLQRVILP